MEPAKVYFSDLRTDEISTLEKLRRLMKAAGFEQIDFKDKYVAVKLHFGEPGNMAYLRPNWARVVCDYVRALDVSPSCDCEAFNDVPIVPNVGMFASFDPVALDTACADMINAQPANPNSAIAHEHEHDHDHPHDHFTFAHPDTDWRAAVEHGEAIGLGTTHYELIEV